MQGNTRALIPRLLQAGIRVYLLPGMSHAKAGLYDGWACFGSANYDRLSLRVNHELNLGTSTPSFVQEIEQSLFLTDMRRAREVTVPPHEPWTRRLRAAFLQSIARQF
jgi:cardiolipin synthase A/B